MNLWNFVSASNICELKRKVDVQRKHLINLNKIKPAIDANPPWIKTNNMDISKRNNKFEQQRNADIYNGNKILLKKMMSLEKKQLKSKKPGSASQRTLMTANKLNEFKKINSENKHLLKRLQSANSTYKKENWLRDIKKNEGYMNILDKRVKDKNYDYNELVVKTLSEFPVIPGLNTNSQKFLRKEDQKSKTNLENDERSSSFRPSTAPKIGVYEHKNL